MLSLLFHVVEMLSTPPPPKQIEGRLTSVATSTFSPGIFCIHSVPSHLQFPNLSNGSKRARRLAVNFFGRHLNI